MASKTKEKKATGGQPKPETVPARKFFTLFKVKSDESGHHVVAESGVPVKSFKTEASADRLAGWLNCAYTAFREETEEKKAAK